MKKLVFKTILFLLPTLIVPMTMVFIDPFKIWFDYDDYYEDSICMLNRGSVCLSLYNKNKSDHEFDSFIFGNSRSQAYKVCDWKKHLSELSEPFHFDASGEGILGVLNTLKYIDQVGGKLSNVLLVLDEGMMMKNQNKKGYLLIAPPALSKESKFDYYKTFLSTSMDAHFVFGYLDYKIFNDYKSYMNTWHLDLTLKGDNINGDIWYESYDEEIENDSIKYYNNLIKMGAFYPREDGKTYNVKGMSEIEKDQLVAIATILKSQNSNCKIIISPLYNQKKISEERLNYLIEVFGPKSVFNYSGKNTFTEEIGNFYESNHFRPHVARALMNEVYN
jgi:hypothetical protein